MFLSFTLTEKPLNRFKKSILWTNEVLENSVTLHNASFSIDGRDDLQVQQRIHASRSEDPLHASVRHETLPIRPSDPYPYEFSYASGQYIFMAEFICWELRGG